jgi:hypothetical protein
MVKDNPRNIKIVRATNHRELRKINSLGVVLSNQLTIESKRSVRPRKYTDRMDMRRAVIQPLIRVLIPRVIESIKYLPQYLFCATNGTNLPYCAL